MTTRPANAPPVLPRAPVEYDTHYMDDLIRTLNLILQELRNPGPLRGTTLVLTGLPSSPTGLESGSLWIDTGNVITIVP